MSEPEEAGTKCSECGTSIECCEFCEEVSCVAAICFGCETVAVGQATVQPHTHGG